MSQDTLQSYIDIFLIKEIRASKKELYNFGRCTPKVFFILYNPSDSWVPFSVMLLPDVYLFFENSKTKAQLKNHIQLVWDNAIIVNTTMKIDIKLCAIIVISDAFVSSHRVENIFKVDFNKYPLPSQDPNRKESLVVSVETGVERSKLMIHPYTRIGKKIQFDNSASEMPQLEDGRLYSLFPQNA
jgi:hypothetical protein